MSTEPNRFKSKLYASLSIPSFVHGYSMGVEFMNQWFLSKFKPGYFKTIHIMGKHPMDDFRRFEVGDYTKRLKPAVSIDPQLVFEYDRENIDLYAADANTLLRRSSYERSFLKDPINEIYLGFKLQQMLINFTYRIRLSTRAEQIDVYHRMDMMFKIGGTWNYDLDMDFHIPYDIVRNIAKDAGFLIDPNGTIAEPEKVLKYMNSHSDIPVLYKLRFINSKKEFFLRMRDLHVHVSTKDKLQADNGEQEGQMSNNFVIDFNCSLRFPTPQFYAYYSSKPIEFSIETYQESEDTIAIDNIKLIEIPEVNSKGWVMLASSNYLPEKYEKYIEEIDISTLFKTDYIDSKNRIFLEDLIKDSMENYFISPRAFIDIQVFTNDLLIPGAIPIKIDWENRKIKFPENSIYSMLYIAIYIDREYVNQKIIDYTKAYEGRL